MYKKTLKVEDKILTLEFKKERLSISRCRAILGDDFKHLSDKEVNDIRIQVEMLADMAIKSYLKKKLGTSK